MKVTLAFMLGLALTGCGVAHKKVSFAPPAVAPTAKEYVDLLKRWTRDGHVIDDFDETLTVDATLHSAEFRSVFVEKWLAVYKIPDAEQPGVRTQMTAEVADMWEVHIESAAHSWDVDNFQFSKKVWRVLKSGPAYQNGPATMSILPSPSMSAALIPSHQYSPVRVIF